MDNLVVSFRKYFRCGQHVDGDEQGIPSKAYHAAIQYNGDKLYKWYFKVYALNDAATSYI